MKERKTNFSMCERERARAITQKKLSVHFFSCWIRQRTNFFVRHFFCPASYFLFLTSLAWCSVCLCASCASRRFFCMILFSFLSYAFISIHFTLFYFTWNGRHEYENCQKKQQPKIKCSTEGEPISRKDTLNTP